MSGAGTAEVAIPPAVTAAAARADELYAAVYGTGAPQEPPQEPPQEAPPEAPQEAPPEAPQESAAQEPQQQPAQKQSSPEHVDWESRYRASQGRLAAAMDRLAQAEARIAGLEQALAARKEEETAPASAAGRELGLVTPQDEEAFGADLLDVVRRAAREEMARAGVDEARREARQARELAATLETRTTEQRRAAMYAELSAQVPDWMEINTSEEFSRWENEIDPMTGRPRVAALRVALENFDTPVIVAHLRAFSAEHAAGAPPLQAPSGAPPQESGAARPERSLEAFAAPGRGVPASRPGGLPGRNETRIWTPAAIRRHYADHDKYIAANRGDEWRRLEQDILKAPSEGRYRPA